MSSKGKIDSIVDIPKIQEQIKFLTDNLDAIIDKLETVSDIAAKLKFDGFGKAKSVKDVADSSSELQTVLKETEPLMKAMNDLTKNKTALEAKLVILQSEEAKKAVELKLAIQARNKELQTQAKLDAADIGLLEKKRIQLEMLKAAYAKAKTSGDQQAILPGLQKLSEEVSELEHNMGVFNRQVGNYEIAGKAMRSELREMTEQLSRMKLEGLDSTEAYEKLRAETGRLADAMGDARADVKQLASDSKSLDQLISVAEGLAGAYTAIEGASALMGVENEDLQKTFVKLQAAMALLNGLRSIQTVLQKESAAYTLAENLQKKLSILLTYAQNKAETGGIITRKLATAAQWALNAAMAANPAGLLLAALAALIGVGYILFKVFTSNAEIQKTYSSAIKNTQKAVENLNRELERNVKAMEASGASQQEIIRAKIAAAQDEYDRQSSLISMLIADYSNLSDEQKEQLKSLQQAQLDNNNKIAGLNDDQIVTSIKQQKDAQKLRIENMKEGINQELAMLKFNFDDQVKAAGNNAELKGQIEANYSKQQNDIRKKYAEDFLKEDREIISKLTESRILIMKDGFDKELADLRFQYGEKIADLEEQLATEENLTVSQRKRIGETILNIRKEQSIAEEKLIVEAQIKANEKQLDLINTRLESVKKGSDQELELKLRSLRIQQDTELAEAEKNGTDKQAIIDKYNQLAADESYNFLIAQLDKESRTRILSFDRSKQIELRSLRDQLEEKLITSEEYALKVQDVESKYTIKRSENALKLAQQELEKIKEKGGDTLAAEEKLTEAQIALDDAKTANFIANRDKEKEAQQKLNEKLSELGQELFNTAKAFSDASFTSQIQNIDEQARKDEEEKQRELARAGNNQALIDQINTKYDEKEKQRDAQRRKIEIEQAKFAKTAAIFQIAINTAQAIAKIWAEVPKVDFGVSTIALTAIAAGIGLAQAAAIAAQPLPKYWRGRTGGPAEFAWVGEYGTEAIQQPSGETYLTPGKPTVTFLPRGASVIPHHELMAKPELFFDRGISALPAPFNTGKLEQKVEDLYEGFLMLASAVKNKKEFHLNITEKGMYKVVQNGHSFQEYLNSKVRI
jgi:hypothetical protein